MDIDVKRSLKEKASSTPKKKRLIKSLAISNGNISEKQSLKNLEKAVRELDEDRDNYFYIETCTMLKHNESVEKSIRYVSEKFRERLADEKLIADTIDRVFNELIADAYSDRTVVYLLKADSNFKDMVKIQAIRQKADNHLIRLIKDYVDIKKPPIKVFVKKLDQLNVSDKQVNISQKNANDLDKNNEKTC
jgi:hypothetical protein